MTKFSPIDDIGDLIPLQKWIDAVECNAFIDYDGYGRLATETEQSDITVKPSQHQLGKIIYPHWATHVLWYNR